MNKFICDICDYVLETDFEYDDIPEDYVCPVCGATKDSFSLSV